MPEPEPELQATANLSPVSPAPVHTAPALAVPALQDTVDTIDAMVAAALAPNGIAAAEEPVVDPKLAPTGDENDDVVDDDSFNGAYAEDTVTDAAPVESHDAQPEDADDYAKTFDSPLGSEQGDGDDAAVSSQQADEPSSSVPRNVSATTKDTTINQSTSNSPSTAVDGDSSAEALVSNSASDPAQSDGQPAQSADNSASDGPATRGHDAAADIQQLVADLTSQPSDPSSDSKNEQLTAGGAASSTSLPSSALPSPSSLPPRPPIPHNTPSYPEQHHPGQTTATVAAAQIAQSAHAQAVYNPAAVTGAPGAGLVAPGMTHAPPMYQSQAPGYQSDRIPEDDYQRKWDQFLADERQYMTEAKWDRFPDGSRIFIGNLSSDKVSKRDVFDMFHRFGRLAQISLKSAYGFVQYHTVEEGKAAVDNLEGVEIKGRRIHLEISRVQDKSKKDRARSPDKGRGRDREGRRGDRFGRDEYRSGREVSPRRGDYRGRDDQYGSRGRNSFDGGRNRRRSRSPGYGRHDNKDSYRRRSPSPYDRSRGDGDLDLPKRYGADVPDVQIILEPSVQREFATWVETAFKGKGLQTEIMYLHPRIPKEQVIHRQAAEGVHAVVDLDLRSQSLGKVPVQAFDRSAGLNNVRFEQYVDLDPATAAEVIIRAKASGASRYGQQQPQPQPYGAYHQGYQQPPQTAGSGYGGQPGHGYPQQQPQQPAGSANDIAALMSQVDPATLQKLIATIQAPPQAGAPAAAPANGGLDLQAILNSLGGQQPPAPQPSAPQAHYGAPYGAPPQQQQPPQSGPPAGADAAAQVQNIMAQLARYR